VGAHAKSIGPEANPPATVVSQSPGPARPATPARHRREPHVALDHQGRELSRTWSATWGAGPRARAQVKGIEGLAGERPRSRRLSDGWGTPGNSLGNGAPAAPIGTEARDAKRQILGGCVGALGAGRGWKRPHNPKVTGSNLALDLSDSRTGICIAEPRKHNLAALFWKHKLAPTAKIRVKSQRRRPKFAVDTGASTLVSLNMSFVDR